jgi:presenilin-like A22 family membrane protease
MADTVLVHPNREKAEAKATKAAVTLLLVTSAALILIILVGGWSKQAGMQIVAITYIVLYLVMAYLVARKWNRGVLPVAAGMAIMFAVVALVAAPAWFANDKTGFADPGLLSTSILGLLCVVLIPVQLLLVAFSLRGLQQKWNVEVEVPREEADRYRRGDHEGDLQTA